MGLDLGEMLKALRLAETWHTGIPKIHRAMRDNGSGAPVFDFDPGRTYFRVTLPAHPGYLVLHAAREAAALWHSGGSDDAINHLRDALARVPQAGALAAQLIEYLAGSGNLSVAREVFTTFEQTDGARGRHLAYMALARAYLDAELRDDAAALLAHAPRPHAVRQQIDLAILHKRSRDLEGAQRQFAAIGSQIQSDPRALHEWAQTKLALARRIPAKDDAAKRLLQREALDTLLRVIELAPDHLVRTSWAWFDIARTRAELGEPEAATQEALHRAISLNPDEPTFRAWSPPTKQRQRG